MLFYIQVEGKVKCRKKKLRLRAALPGEEADGKSSGSVGILFEDHHTLGKDRRPDDFRVEKRAIFQRGFRDFSTCEGAFVVENPKFEKFGGTAGRAVKKCIHGKKKQHNPSGRNQLKMGADQLFCSGLIEMFDQTGAEHQIAMKFRQRIFQQIRFMDC